MWEMKVKVIGDVQGVGFRANTKSLALKLGLTGYVANSPDGSVEIVAQGPKKNLEELVTKLKAQFNRYIQEVKTEFHHPKREYNQFTIQVN